MPFIYASTNKSGSQALENMATSASGNAEIDFFFLKPGASRPVVVVSLRVQGKGNQLTALSGISIRMKQYTTVASASGTGGTAITPRQKHMLAPACVATGGLASTNTGAVTVGTTPFYVGMGTMGGSGPGGWVAINPDDVPAIDGGVNASQDLVSSTAAPSALSFEFEIDHQEG